jgi:hypothetical protein
MFIATVTELAQEVSKYESGTLVILATEKSLDFKEVQPILKDSKVPIFGAFFPGLIAHEELIYKGFLLLHYSFEAEIFSFDSKELETISLSDRSINKGTAFVLMDGLAEGNQAFLNSLYYELGQNFKFIGSGAGSLDLVQKPCVFDKYGIYENKAIVLLLNSDVAIGIKHGYSRLSGPYVATDTSSNKIAELNWENAYDTYSEVVNNDSVIPISKEDFFSISKGYPLGINRKDHEDIVRDPISVDADGTLNCIDDVPENAALYILKGEPLKLIDAAKSSCEEALKQVDGSPEHCLLIDCVTRVLYLGDDFNKEIKTATQKIHSVYPDMHVKGVLSMGEISTFKDGRLELYNKTFLTTIVYDK